MTLQLRKRFYAGLLAPREFDEPDVDGYQVLPFVVRLVQDREDFDRVIRMRQRGYRLDSLDSALDEFDFRSNAQVYGAFDKVDGRLLGTIRLNLGDRGANEISSQVVLPDPWRRMTKIDARRYVVPRGRYAMQVKIMLMKTLFEVAARRGIQAIVAASPEALASAYRMMHFEDIVKGGLILKPHGSRRPVTVVAVEVASLKPSWERDAELAEFYRVIFGTQHPDLLLQPECTANPLSVHWARYLSGSPESENLILDA